MDLCPTCRKTLYRTDACKGAGVECGRKDGGSKKSTAARMDVRREAVTETSVRPSPEGTTIPAAGTQAPPVDTKPSSSNGLGRPLITVGNAGSNRAEGSVETTKRGRGRPRTIADLKAYRLEKQRQRRAKLKEGK